MATLFDQLKEFTTIVADTGDIDQIKEFQPTDATTNPSLMYAAAKIARYQHLVDDGVHYAKKKGGSEAEQLSAAMDKIFVNFGVEITKIVPGRVSTEVDARLSFDVDASVKKARELIKLYADAGVGKDRVLIKLASTWEGIKAAEILEKEGINCNLTLLFCFCQAVAAAEVGAFLISPFVGRITDWYKKNTGVSQYAAAEDPGVLSVSRIFNYYKKFGYKTVVMGASFRNKEQILELAGCDRLTIAPSLLQELRNGKTHLVRKLVEDAAHKLDLEKVHLDEKKFRWQLNEDAMATEKLAEGIRNFTKDIVLLEDIVKQKLHKA